MMIATVLSLSNISYILKEMVSMKKTLAFITSFLLLSAPVHVTAFAEEETQVTHGYIPDGLPVSDDTIEYVDTDTADILFNMRDRLLADVYVNYPDSEIHAVTASNIAGDVYVMYTSDTQAELDDAKAYCEANGFDMSIMKFYLYDESKIVEESNTDVYTLLTNFIKAENVDVFSTMEKNAEGKIEIVCNTTEAYNAIEKFITDNSIARDDVFLVVNEDNATELTAYEKLTSFIRTEKVDIFSTIEKNADGKIEIVCNTTEAFNAIEKFIADNSITRDDIFLVVNEDNSTEGDANTDGRLTLADAVAVLQYLANEDEYRLTAQGMLNADIVGNDGINTGDALEIQRLAISE